MKAALPPDQDFYLALLPTLSVFLSWCIFLLMVTVAHGNFGSHAISGTSLLQLSGH